MANDSPFAIELKRPCKFEVRGYPGSNSAVVLGNSRWLYPGQTVRARKEQLHSGAHYLEGHHPLLVEVEDDGGDVDLDLHATEPRAIKIIALDGSYVDVNGEGYRHGQVVRECPPNVAVALVEAGKAAFE